MSNQLTRVIDATKADPHGEVARNVCHWTAVKVMGWKYVENERHPEKNHYLAQGLKGIKAREWARVMFRDEWQPLTDANHTRMLVFKWGVNYFNGVAVLGDASDGVFAFNKLKPYSDDFAHDACQVLRKCHHECVLTDETLKGF